MSVRPRHRRSPTQSDVPVGEMVELPTLTGTVKGLVLSNRVEAGLRFLRIYSYSNRRENEYRVDHRGRLRLRAAEYDETSDESGADDPSPAAAPAEAAEISHSVASVLVPLIAAVLFMVTIFPLFQGAVTQITVGALSYDGFLRLELRLSQLVSAVGVRIRYRPDLEDYWSRPEDAWTSRQGDCEDYAMVVSAHLRAHGVPHAVVGLTLTEGLAGHVVVVADTAGGRFLLDPTRATATTGLRRFPAGTSYAEIAGEYGPPRAAIYGDSVPPGRPKPISVYQLQ